MNAATETRNFADFKVADMTLALHERPYRPADLFNAGMENPDDLFVAANEEAAARAPAADRRQR